MLCAGNEHCLDQSKAGARAFFGTACSRTSSFVQMATYLRRCFLKRAAAGALASFSAAVQLSTSALATFSVEAVLSAPDRFASCGLRAAQQVAVQWLLCRKGALSAVPGLLGKSHAVALSISARAVNELKVGTGL